MGLLFESHPLIAYDVRWEQAYRLIPAFRHKLTYPIDWREEVIKSWHAEAPMVGGEMITQVVVDIQNVPRGREIRLIYPIDLHGHNGRAILVWP